MFWLRNKKINFCYTLFSDHVIQIAFGTALIVYLCKNVPYLYGALLMKYQPLAQKKKKMKIVVCCKLWLVKLHNQNLGPPIIVLMV